MNIQPFRRLMSLIPPRPPSPNNQKFDYDQSTYQPKLQVKRFQLDDLPLILNKQHLPVMSLVPKRLKTEVYRKCQPSQHKVTTKSEDERYNTIEVCRNQSKILDTRKISCANSYQKQQHKLRKLNYSYEVRRRRSSNFMIFSQNKANHNLNKIRITKQALQDRMTLRYNNSIASRMLSFFEIPQYMDFPFWKSLMQKLFLLNQEQKMVVVYRLLHNKRYISSSELFDLQLNVQSDAIHKDVQTIMNYIKFSLNKETVDDEEIEFLKKSSIFTESLKISHLLTWTEVYQVDQTISVKKNKGSTYKRQVPLENFISNYLSSEKEENIKQSRVSERYPTHFTEKEPFSITFPIFRKIFSQKQMSFWSDIVAFFCGVAN